MAKRKDRYVEAGGRFFLIESGISPPDIEKSEEDKRRAEWFDCGRQDFECDYEDGDLVLRGGFPESSVFTLELVDLVFGRTTPAKFGKRIIREA